MTKPIVRDPIYRRRRFDAEIIELCVRWYITYRLSYRDLQAMMAERGIVVSHTTIHRHVLSTPNAPVPSFWELAGQRLTSPVPSMLIRLSFSRAHPLGAPAHGQTALPIKFRDLR